MSTVAKLSALIGSGLSPRKCIEVVGEKSIPAELLELIESARRFGAPLSRLLHEYQDFEANRMVFESEISKAQAVPIATRRLLLWLPAVALFLGQISGLNPLAALGSPLGLIGFGLAGALIYLGAKWSARMLRNSTAKPEHPGKDLIIFRMGLDSGLGLSKVSELQAGLQNLDEIVLLAKKTGAPLRSLVSSEVETLLLNQSTSAIAQAHKLSVSLLIPLSLTILPAFLILTLFPMIIGIVNNN